METTEAYERLQDIINKFMATAIPVFRYISETWRRIARRLGRVFYAARRRRKLSQGRMARAIGLEKDAYRAIENARLT